MGSRLLVTALALVATPMLGCAEEPRREPVVETTCEPAQLVPCRCGQNAVGRAQCLDDGQQMSFCSCGEEAAQAPFTACEMGDRLGCPCPSTAGFSLCDVTGVYMMCTCTAAPPPNQGTGGMMGAGLGGMGGGTGGMAGGTGSTMAAGTGGRPAGTGGTGGGTGGQSGSF